MYHQFHQNIPDVLDRRRMMAMMIPNFLETSSVAVEVSSSARAASVSSSATVKRVSALTTLNSSSFFLQGPRELEHTLEHSDMYSGMWWQDVTSFQKMRVDLISNLESAIYHALMGPRIYDVRMTRNYLDFAVEHLSIFFRNLQLSNKKVIKRATAQTYLSICQTKLNTYIQRTFQQSKEGATLDPSVTRVVNSTIAIIPFGFQGGKKNPEHILRLTSLEATLTSLWYMGIGRVVVMIGSQPIEQQHMEEIFQKLKNHDQLSGNQHAMELEYIQNLNPEESKRLPKHALVGMHQALNGEFDDDEQTKKWLGNDTSRWKYVYYTEPDLIVHTQLSVLPYLTDQLEQGKLVIAHRLQLVQHESDFPSYPQPNLVVPAVGSFSNVTTIDSVKGDSCIDAGMKNKPALEFPKCDKFRLYKWWRCGFEEDYIANYRDVETVHKLFQRLRPYSLLRLQQGTGFVLLASNQHGRKCNVQIQPTD